MYLLLIDWWFILEKLILVAVIITLSLVIAMYATYAERKVAAWLAGPAWAEPGRTFWNFSTAG